MALGCFNVSRLFQKERNVMETYICTFMPCMETLNLKTGTQHKQKEHVLCLEE